MKEEFNLRKINNIGEIFPVIDTISKDWYLITANYSGVVNTMTASWGQIGYLWNKPIFTIYVRPQRYTYHLLESSNYFSVSFFEGQKENLSYLGRASGRTEDKIAKTGFHLIDLGGVPAFSEAKITLVLKKIYVEPLKKECFVDQEIPQNSYPSDDFSVVFIGEIIGVYQET
ncbi:MAG: flavin reductase [Bacilli bacterium]|jgi:flavin reductase (DIM6/NTAB) family NADH-FMN oxidoreductase RutF